MTALVAIGSVATAEPLDTETANLYKYSLVRTIVDGTTESGVCAPRGTGFFIDGHGHILTAAHNVLPCEEFRWKTGPTIEIEMLREDGSLGRANAAVIYRDTQTDLALLRAQVTDSPPLPLAPAGTLEPNSQISLMTFEKTQAEPAAKLASVEHVFNPSSFHGGLIDISAPDVRPSASGGPVFDSAYDVAAVFTKGRGETGDGAVPISYASSLFEMAGVSYPSNVVREVLDELRKDTVEWNLVYDPGTDIVTITYKKRLQAGLSPVIFKAEVDVYASRGVLRGSDLATTFTDEVFALPPVGKQGLVRFENIGSKADQTIDIINEHRRASNEDEIGRKSRAEVTIRATFDGGLTITPLRDVDIEF